MKIALIQMSAQPKKEDSLAIAGDYIKKAASEKADIAVLPEMFNAHTRPTISPSMQNLKAANAVRNYLNMPQKIRYI